MAASTRPAEAAHGVLELGAQLYLPLERELAAAPHLEPQHVKVPVLDAGRQTWSRPAAPSAPTCRRSVATDSSTSRGAHVRASSTLFLRRQPGA